MHAKSDIGQRAGKKKQTARNNPTRQIRLDADLVHGGLWRTPHATCRAAGKGQARCCAVGEDRRRGARKSSVESTSHPKALRREQNQVGGAWGPV